MTDTYCSRLCDSRRLLFWLIRITTQKHTHTKCLQTSKWKLAPSLPPLPPEKRVKQTDDGTEAEEEREEEVEFFYSEKTSRLSHHQYDQVAGTLLLLVIDRSRQQLQESITTSNTTKAKDYSELQHSHPNNVK